MQVFDRVAARNFPTVRLVGKDTNEIVSSQEAINRAEDAGLDLILVSDQTTPPVVKIEDLKKVQYAKKKAQKGQIKRTSLKEMRFKVNISDHDFMTKINAIQRMIDHGDQVKVVVRLKGRERDTPERAANLLERVGQSVQHARMKRVPGPIHVALLEPAK